MPTVADLERLEALVANLRDLNGKQRGELIEAAAWNRLVSAVIDIGRATIDEVSNEVPGHKHTDQVSLEWLDPRLRATILAAGDAGGKAQLDKLERQLTKFGRVLDEFSDRLTRLQKDVSGVATRDVEREASVGTALRKLDGVFDAREDVASLRGSLRSIETQVRTAATLSSRLQTDTGEDIDFNALSGRITTLESLGERLTLPDGNAFDGAAYARDLAQLRAELVTESELREALETVETNFSGDLRGELLDDARAAALEANADQLASLEDTLRSDQRAGLRELDASLDSRIASATGDLREQVLSDARAEQTELLNARLGRFEAGLLAEVERRDGAVSASVAGQLDDLTASIRGDVTDSVLGQVEARLGGFDDRFATLDRSTAVLSEQMVGLTRTVNATAARIESVNRELLAADARLNAQLTERITSIELSLDDRIRLASEDLRVAIRAERETEMAVMRDQMTVQMTRTMRDVARTEVSMATSNLRGEMTEIAQAEIRAETDSIRDEMREEATISDARLSGMVSAEVRRQTGDLDRRIDARLETHDLTVRRDVDPVIFEPVFRP